MEVFPSAKSLHKTDFYMAGSTICHPRTAGERTRMMKRVGSQTCLCWSLVFDLIHGS